MNNNTPNSNSMNERNGNYTPADGLPSQEYQNLVTEYNRSTKKERAVQISGSILSLFASGIEIVIFVLIDNIWERRVPLDIIGRISGIFLILMLVLVLGVIQLRTVSGWNKNIERGIQNQLSNQHLVKNTAPSEFKTQNLTMRNYERIDQTKKMRVLASLILLLCLFFFIQYTRPIILSVPVNFLRIYSVYRVLRQLAFLIVVCYSIIEIIQLIKWTIRLRQMRNLENFLIAEIPELAQLENLSLSDK